MKDEDSNTYIRFPSINKRIKNMVKANDAENDKPIKSNIRLSNRKKIK